MEVTLDYSRALEIAHKACQRAACFLGLGLNAARDPNLTNYALSPAVNISFLPEGLPKETVDGFKQEFENWIITNGLRELIEGFGVFYDELFALSLLARKKGKPLGKVDKALLRKVCEGGLPSKQKALRDEFEIASEFGAHLKSIYEARNCLAHNRGIVTHKYTRLQNSETELTITWRVMEIVIRYADGQEITVGDPKLEPVPARDVEGQILGRPATHSRAFRVNEVIKLTPRELAEICLFASLACHAYYDEAVKFAKSCGIEEKPE